MPVEATAALVAELENTIDGGRVVEVHVRHRWRRVVFLGA